MKALTGMKWLNEEGINFYRCAVLTEQDREICACTLHQRSHFFSSFFLPKLYHDNSKDLQKAEKTGEKQNSAFQLSFSCLPQSCWGKHWTTIIKNMHKKTSTVSKSIKIASSDGYWLTSLAISQKFLS